MKQFIKKTWRDLKYLVIGIVSLVIGIVCWVVYIGGIFFGAAVIFSLAVLTKPPKP